MNPVVAGGEPGGPLHIHVASGNAGKLAEIRNGADRWQRHAGRRMELVAEALPEFSRLPPCEEDAASFAGNARKKALHYSSYSDGLILADDSGLAVDALGGEPGIFSARYAGPQATDQQNNRKLLERLRGVPRESRTARFVCVLALAQAGRVLAEFEGVAEGTILERELGSGGFGYDPLFLDSASGRTFAELSPGEKLDRSHRGKALRAMFDWLAGHTVAGQRVTNPAGNC